MSKIIRSDPVGRVLIIAGSDSGGGAGVQADIKSCAAFGAYSATAITAITAQNTVGVQQVSFVSAEMVRAQIRSVLSDIGADIIKIGMLGQADIVQTVAEEIEDTEATIILDPVMVATSGDSLLDDPAIEMMKTRLLPMADMITPNVPEAEILTGQTIQTIEDLSKAGEALLAQGAYSVLMKGGHLGGKVVADIWLTAEERQIFTSPRLYSRHTHGTGCTLASAIAANLAVGASFSDAVQLARDYVFEGIRTAPKLGSGHGPLNHGLTMREDPSEIDRDGPSQNEANPFSILKSLKD